MSDLTFVFDEYEDEADPKWDAYMQTEEGKKQAAAVEAQIKKEQRQKTLSGVFSTLGSIATTVITAVGKVREASTAEKTREELQRKQAELDAQLADLESKKQKDNTVMIVVAAVVVVAVIFFVMRKK